MHRVGIFAPIPSPHVIPHPSTKKDFLTLRRAIGGGGDGAPGQQAGTRTREE